MGGSVSYERGTPVHAARHVRVVAFDLDPVTFPKVEHSPKVNSPKVEPFEPLARL